MGDASRCVEVDGDDSVSLGRDEVCALLGKRWTDFDVSLNVDTSPTVLMANGAALVREGDLIGAQTCFEQAAFSHPLNAESSFNMGLFFEITHQPIEMARWMERTLSIDPQHYMARVLLAKYKERIGSYGEAMQIYNQAIKLDPNPHLARGQINQIIGDHKVCLEAFQVWSIAAPHILRESASWHYSFPTWQENFLHPRADPPKTSLLSDGVCVWDDVLGESLLSQLTDSVDDMFQFVFTNFWLNPDESMTTCWLPREKQAVETAVELAIRLLISRFLGEDAKQFCGVEWWGKMRTESRGQGLHYDQSEADDPELQCTICGMQQYTEWVHGNPWRPRWSSVLFLSDEGGPTVMLEQIHSHEGRNVPSCPQRGYMAMPKRGRWLVFRGDLFHGCLPIEDFGKSQRKVLIFNLWRSHRPPPKHCNTIDYQHQPVLKKFILTPQQIDAAVAAETLRVDQAIGSFPVVRERFTKDSLMCLCSRFGYLHVPLPMTSAENLKAGSGFYEFDWRSAAEDHAAKSGLQYLQSIAPRSQRFSKSGCAETIATLPDDSGTPCFFEIVD